MLSTRSQRGLLALSGPGATLLVNDRAAFVTRFVAVRFWLMQLAVVLQRTAVDPQPHCDSPWIPTDRQTHNRGGYRGKWYTPGWPWPFNDGVGVVVGNCTYPRGATAPQPQPSECCSVIFGKVSGAKCLESAHHMLLEQTLAAHATEPATSVAAPLPLGQTLASDGSGAIDAAALRQLAKALTQPVVWVELPAAALDGGPLPRVVGLSDTEKAALDELVHDECREMLKSVA